MATYNPLQSAVLTSSSSEVIFSGIDQSYTDLILSFNGIGSTSANLNVQLNGDTGSNYSFTALYGTGSTAASNRGTGTTYIRAGYITAAQTGTILQFQNYANTTTYKTVLMRDYPSGGDVEIAASLWRNTAAITSIRFYPSSGTFAAGTTIDLYGIKAGAPQALGGDTVTTDGNYWYHTFRSTGAFIPQRSLNVDYLVVAGGGGGGGYAYTGGGGAGGLRSTVTATGGGGSLESALTVTPQAYTVTVGAGGAGGANVATTAGDGTTGSDSIFSSITSAGGGGGAGYGGTTIGKSGGSGGGGAAGGAGGSASPSGQGYAGGASSGSGFGGGGGGAGAVGAIGTGSNSGNGGNGVASSITGSSVTYAGGGGGGASASPLKGAGTGGTGGGGNGGASSSNGSAATANTGSGGGGGGWNAGTGYSGGNGGSGIVIVRYAV